jgi:RimJ/RimL family protein N-acetyltransferase
MPLRFRVVSPYYFEWELQMSLDASLFPVGSGADLKAKLEQLRIRIAGRLQLGLYSESMRYGLCRDLSAPFEKPNAKIPIEVRPATDADLRVLLSLDGQNDNHDRLEIAWRRAFADKGAKRCFVAVDLRNNTPCYIHWLFNAADNEFIQRLGGLPLLQPHEALMENAYTPAKYRRLGIMSAAMARIAERATDIGASQVITFVDEDNIPSLKGCQRAGFHPHLLHHRVQMVFGLIKWNEFEPLAENDPRRTLKF